MTGEKPPKKIRLDLALVERGLAPSRERARALILAGLVVVGEHAAEKAGQTVAIDAPIRLKGDNCPYVSRGGLKLEGALQHFKIDPTGTICLDVGASTGGFTDCLLQHGAAKAYTIDVGTNQLAWSLRQDPRVVAREQFHVKDLLRADVPAAKVDLIVVDVSFISLRLALPPLRPFLAEGSGLLALVKPQFEAGREKVGKGGVVRDPADREAAVAAVAVFLAEMGYPPAAPYAAPITGPAGNQEYFLFVPPRGAI
ncbi:MAG: TlyA family RNA methyltransferase [Myxococcales bacterium]|nr:MAG: TlyA family RNA methyltransferase [Myxococcales bacterium]